MLRLRLRTDAWPIAGSFRIAHGSVSEIQIVTLYLSDGANTGRGECRPYARYNETPTSAMAQIEAVRQDIENGVTSADIQRLLPAGAARNALDCALWDLKCKQDKRPIWELLDIPAPAPRCTAFTLSIDSPANMAKAARAAKAFPILKLKIDGNAGLHSCLDSCLAVLEARPDAQLIIDANESLTPKTLPRFRAALAHAPVLLIEQPVKASVFDQIENRPDSLPVLCADESLHARKDLQILWDAGYRGINVKLDKTGGITEALALMCEAKSMGFLIMAGCMVGTSLAMAPMMALESYADFIDLDGPLLLAKDIENGIAYNGAIMSPASQKLWG